eukprot:Platyproteum_vivax@DN14373_c0_g1_i1.p1
MASIASLPPGIHNFLVFCFLMSLSAWLAHIVYTLWKCQIIIQTVSRRQALYLDGMAIYANDFQQLIWNHFNQILRIRRTVPPVAVPCVVSSVTLQPSTLKFDVKDNALNVSFTFQSSVASTAQVYWGASVTAMNQLLEAADERNMLSISIDQSNDSHIPPEGRNFEMCMLKGGATSERSGGQNMFGDWVGAGKAVAQSPVQHFPEGLEHEFTLPVEDRVNIKTLFSTMGQNNTFYIPLLIVLQSKQYRHLGMQAGIPIRMGIASVSVVRLRAEEQEAAANGIAVPWWQNVRDSLNVTGEVIKHVVMVRDCLGPQEVQDLYGLEDPNDRDCLICMASPKDTMLLPCRHCCLCYNCLRNLTREKCPICRSNFSAFVTFPMKPTTHPPT